MHNSKKRENYGKQGNRIITGDGIRSAPILRQQTCLEGGGGTLSGHATSKEWKGNGAMCDELQTHLPEDRFCLHFGCSVEKTMET